MYGNTRSQQVESKEWSTTFIGCCRDEDHGELNPGKQRTNRHQQARPRAGAALALALRSLTWLEIHEQHPRPTHSPSSTAQPWHREVHKVGDSLAAKGAMGPGLTEPRAQDIFEGGGPVRPVGSFEPRHAGGP